MKTFDAAAMGLLGCLLGVGLHSLTTQRSKPIAALTNSQPTRIWLTCQKITCSMDDLYSLTNLLANKDTYLSASYIEIVTNVETSK